MCSFTFQLFKAEAWTNNSDLFLKRAYVWNGCAIIFFFNMPNGFIKVLLSGCFFFCCCFLFLNRNDPATWNRNLIVSGKSSRSLWMWAARGFLEDTLSILKSYAQQRTFQVWRKRPVLYCKDMDASSQRRRRNECQHTFPPANWRESKFGAECEQ